MDVSDRGKRAAGEAAEWWLDLQDAPASRELRERFVDWLRESPVHVAEFLRVAQVHSALEGFRDWGGIDTTGARAPEAAVDLLSYRRGSPPEAASSTGGFGPSLNEAERPRSTTRRRWLVAASIAVLAVAGGAWLTWFAGARVIETGRGERREVTLADGSALQIDPQTRLRIRYEDRARNVSLDKGRALFKVAKDAWRPFIVHTDLTQVRALGTEFGVEREQSGTVVTVAEGRVSVAPTAAPRSEPAGSASAQSNVAAESGAGAVHVPGHTAQVLLQAGEQVVVPRSGPANAVRKVDSKRALAWAEGRLVFENQTVAEVVAQFNRYNFVRLRVADATLAGRPVSGVFDASEPESFIGFIQSVAAVRVDRKGSDITISSAP